MMMSINVQENKNVGSGSEASRFHDPLIIQQKLKETYMCKLSSLSLSLSLSHTHTHTHTNAHIIV